MAIMATLTFDTLKFTKRLIEAGVSQKQAEAEAEVLAEALETNLSEMVTKGDLRMELAQMETRLIRWIVAVSGLVVALIKIL